MVSSPSAAPVRTARCCCGHLSVRVTGEPVLNGLCHCEDCRRRTGSAFGWSAYFPEEAVSLSGPARRYEPDSGTGTRHFCGDCGTTLYWHATGLPELVGLAGGAFVDDPLPPPDRSYRDRKRCAWLGLPDSWQRKG